MSLDTVMNMSITVESRSPTQAGFGTPLLFGYHAHNLGQLVKEYSQADDMLDDGFTANDALYKAAQAVKSQNPAPDTFKIGRRVTPLTQKIQLTPQVTTEGYKYKGTIGGKAFTYVVGAGASLSTVAAGILAAINALSAGTTATADSSASVTGSVVGPWGLTSGDTLKVAIDTNVPGSPTTATFTGVAAARETTNSSSTPFALADGDVLTVKIDEQSTAQSIVFNTASFVNIATATAAEVAAVINGQLVGGRATITSSTKVTITSDKKGTGSHVEVTGGTANSGSKLNFATAEVNGSGNVADIASVTFNEVKTIVELAVAGCTVTSAAGAARITSNTTGVTSKVDIDVTSTADAIFGFDNATHLGLAGGNVVTCTANTAGAVVDFDWASTTPPKKLAMKDVTEDTTTDDELPVVDAEDDDWYALLVIDSTSKATTLNGAGWIETKRKLFVAQTSDTEVLDSIVTDDVASALKDSSYARTGVIFHRAIGGKEWLAAGWLAGALTTTPGSATMAFKSVAGVEVDRLETSEENTLYSKNGSDYTNLGLPGTFEGKSGAGEFLDTVRFIDWVYARMRESVIGVLANNLKIPFTDNGVDVMRLAIMHVIQLGQAAGGFAADPPPTVTAPLVKNVPSANRIARTLPDVNWTAQLAGAIHRLSPVRGRVSV